jgi:hypothetical protein
VGGVGVWGVWGCGVCGGCGVRGGCGGVMAVWAVWGCGVTPYVRRKEAHSNTYTCKIENIASQFPPPLRSNYQ